LPAAALKAAKSKSDMTCASDDWTGIDMGIKWFGKPDMAMSWSWAASVNANPGSLIGAAG
jgi:hypothetical protein